MLRQIISPFLIIFIGLTGGYIAQILIERNILRLPFSLEKIRKFIQKLSILFFFL